LGQPKQLVLYKGMSLINRAIKLAQSIKRADTYVILGANAEKIFLQMPKAICYVNSEWQKGMGNTMAYATQATKNKNYKGVIFMTSDQPFVSKSILKALIAKGLTSNKRIVVSKYNEGQGIPTYFSKEYFKPLLKLKGDTGAKKIIKQNKDDVTYINFKKGSFDIDTPKDLQYKS